MPDLATPPPIEVIARPTPYPSGRTGTLRRLLGGIPTLIVLAGLAAVGWWGHHSGWRLPKFSEMAGRTAAPDDWCPDHGVAESICVECHEELMPRSAEKGWCKVHGVAECPLCHLELAQLAKPRKPSAADLDRADRALKFAPRAANNPACLSHHRRLQFADIAAAEQAGIGEETAFLAPAQEVVSAPGEIGYDRTRVAHMSSRAPGSVWRVFKHLGDPVKAGDLLALIDAAEVGKAKAELLQAVAAIESRSAALAGVKASGGAVSQARVREAEAAVREAEIRVGAGCQALVNLGLPIDEADARALTPAQLQEKLRLLGVPESVAKGLDPKATTANLLPLIAPADGVITSREIVAGEVVDAGRILFESVDPTRLWLTLDAKAEDAKRLRVGLPVRFVPDAGGEALGTLNWVSPHADPKTRTVKARADLADPQGLFKANSFGSGEVVLRDEPAVVSLPSDAVQWEGCCHVVFVRDKNYLKPDASKVFHVRKVRLGAKDAKNTEIISGVLPGELVAVQGSGLLLTELLRADLGEGCACHAKK